jgi:DNA invertase Pin-like site-specific DNA recombinase
MSKDRAALYIRVSSQEQAEADVSVPDQRRQLQQYAHDCGYEVAQEYVDAGATGRNDRRHGFQSLMSDAEQLPRPFDHVIVYSTSRFARQTQDHLKNYIALRKRGIELHSITQPIDGSAQGDLLRTILAAFDQFMSDENSRHVTRARLENARQGFWNGSRPPFGYRTYVAEVRGSKEKKKLAIDENEAPIVKTIFALYSSGHGISNVVKELNSIGFRMRGNPFTLRKVNTILRDSVYTGTYFFNQRTKGSNGNKPIEDWIPVECPSIVKVDEYRKIQERLTLQNPKKTPPRHTTSEILFGGLLKCGYTGYAMSIGTGKGGRYRYYKCNNNQRKKHCECGGMSFRMEYIDDLVIEHFVDRILNLERMKEIILPLLQDGSTNKWETEETLLSIRKEIGNCKKANKNLIQALETSGHTDVIEERLTENKKRVRDLERQMYKLQDDIKRSVESVSDESIEQLCNEITERVRNKDPKLVRPYLRSFIHKIDVFEDEIVICGSGDRFLRAAAKLDQNRGGGGSRSSMAANNCPRGPDQGPSSAEAEVPTFVPEWRPNRFRPRQRRRAVYPGR